MKQFYEMTITEVAECLIKQELPNGKTISTSTAVSSLSRVLPMLKESIEGQYPIVDDDKLNHIRDVIKRGNEFVE